MYESVLSAQPAFETMRHLDNNHPMYAGLPAIRLDDGNTLIGCTLGNLVIEVDKAGKEVWLLVEWPSTSTEPTKYFFCDLPPDYSLRRLVQVAKARWKIEQDYQQLKEELGLDHYEGRSWMGWHHHVTLVMLAHSFLTLETLRAKKNFWLDPAEDAW